MSIKNYFDKNISSVESAASGSSKTESYDYILAKNKKNESFVPRIDYSSASSFSFYGSAKLYYEKAVERIYNNYPYDGSRKEKVEFHLDSSQFEEWVFNNLYPKTNGYINFSYTGWGTQTSTADGYGLPEDVEYIYSRGGLHTASSGMSGKELFKTFDKSVKYDTDKNRTTNYRMNIPDGITLEFWMKKDSFDTSKTEKEVILDLWNGNASSSADYGRFTVTLTGSGPATSGQDVFIVTLQSGTVGFFEQTIGSSAITTGSLSNWHHYALSFTSASNGVESRIYLDGNLNEKKTLGTSGVNEIGGLINGYLGALQTSPSSSNGAATAAQYSGKLSASLDEFRFWKTKRTSEHISTYWNQTIGSGTNTDDSNTNLGVYYKFNEGVVGNASLDSVVLDYSGRIANGTWSGYSSGARSTDSAIVLSNAASTEVKDPIVHSTHPDVVTLKANLINSGSARDADNGNMLINRFPNWIVEEDESVNSNFSYLTQIISSFLDEIYLEISELRKLKFADYYSTEYKPLPFANRLLLERGIDVKDILKIASTLEKYEKRNVDTTVFENDVNDIKNIIFQNIYNNLPKILKSKGTERSFRNMLRCFGVDDEIVKLNIYTNKGTHFLNDKYKVTSYNKKVIDFGNSNAFSSIVFQTSSLNNSRTYIYGSDSSKNEKYNAFTFEINALMPFKTPSNEDAYVYYGELTSSIGGFHQAVSDPTDYTFATSNDASLQIFAERDEIDSKKAKFRLKSHDGTVDLTSSLYFDVYENSLWTLAARVKPTGYPFYGSYSSPQQNYIVDFYGVRHKAGEIDDFFHLTSSVSYALGSSLLSNRKRVFVGANTTNFTGSTLQKSDVKISNCRFYLDYLENVVLNEHNKDVSIHGSNKTFEGNTAFGTSLGNKKISSLETIALNWDFNKVTGSSATGDFIIEDISSGSTDTIYGWADEIIRREHRGLGYNFENSDTNFLSREFLTLYKKELPEISYSADNIKIAGVEEQAFLTDDDVSDSLYALEKSMYQVISEKMLENLSSTSEMSNLFGKAIERYRFNYKKLDYARRVFFDDVEEDPDFDKFTEYFRWIDNSIYSFVKDLIPASVSFVDNISDVVESHIFERNKVRTLLPNKFVNPSPDDHINSIRELRYNWKFGHSPAVRIPDVYGNFTFNLDAVSSIDHGSTLQITGGATTFLAEINDPSVAVAYPNADLILRTGSNGLAFKASGSSIGAVTGVNYGVSGDTLENKSFTISWWYYSGDSSNSTGIFLKASSPSTVHRVEFDGDVEISLYNAAGTNDTARFNDSNTQSDSGEWNHYVAFFDVDNLSTGGPRLWKNSTELSSTGYTAIGGTTPTINGLSVQLDDQTGFQDLVFWSGSLSQADVNELYNSGSWYNPSLHTQKTKIIDWYKFGYESYWAGLGYSVGDDLSEQNPSDNKFISSSFGTGNNDLRVLTAYDEDIQFVSGINPYGASKSNSVFWGELSSSLSSSFADFNTSFTGTGPASFTVLSKSVGSEVLSISEAGNDFAAPIATQGAATYLLIDDNDHCLWQKERRKRTDITARETIRKVVENDNNQKATTLADNSGNTYLASTYATRRLSRAYKESVSMVRSLHGGINYEIQKNRRISKNVLEPHSKLNSSGIPLNVILVGAGTGQGIELKTECNDVIDPNLKEKFNVQTFLGKFAAGTPGGAFAPIDDTQSFSFGLKGAFALPFNIISASVNSGYNKAFHDGWKPGTIITNVHSDTAMDKNDVPLQGPFTERWVGGHQSRHQDINRHDPTLIDGETLNAPPNNLHNIYTRPESHRLLLIESGGGSDGAIGLVDAQYGVTAITGHPNTGSYPDVAKKKAVYFREETAKRPVNIKNIQTTTASFSHGNYREQYEILSVASGKQHNNPLFRSIVDTHQYLPTAIANVLPKTTNYNTLIGVSNHSAGNVFGVGESNILNNSVDTNIEGEAGNIQFELKAVADIGPGSALSTLQVTGGATTFLAEIRNPSSVTTKTSVPDKILYTGSYGLSFHSTGSDDNAQAISSATISEIGTNDFSVSFWLYSNDYSGGGSNTQIVFYDGGSSKHRIFVGNDDIRVRMFNNASANANSDFNTNTRSDDEEWHHYVVGFKVSDLSEPAKLWKDGVELSEIGSYTGPAQSIVNINRIEILVDDENGLQDIVLWDKLLVQQDVNLIYASGSWCNPATHPSSSNIVDWWKFGYEDYWSTLGYTANENLTDHGSAPYTISSSFGTGNNDLEIGSDDDEHMMFRTGNNPFGSAKSNATFWNELSSSLSSSFTTGSIISYAVDGAATFTLQTPVTGPIGLAASRAGADFTDPSVNQGTSPILETGYINVTSRTTGATQKSVISTRFSAPGGIETMTYGFLDAHNQEMSAYNAMTYRNLLVRGSGSGESGTIRLNDHLGNREGLLTHLSRHSGKFGADSVHGSVTSGDYVTTPSYHKIPRNVARKPASTSTLSNPSFNLDHDNFFVRSTLPRSDYQYSWITSSLGSNYSITSGKQRMFGYAPRDGIMSSSHEVHGETGYVAAITFPTASELFGE